VGAPRSIFSYFCFCWSCKGYVVDTQVEIDATSRDTIIRTRTIKTGSVFSSCTPILTRAHGSIPSSTFI